MKKIGLRLFSILFILYLTIFALYTLYAYVIKKNIEQQNTNKKFNFFTEKIDDAVSFNIPKKRIFVKIDNTLTKLLVSSIKTNIVIQGKDNFLFYAIDLGNEAPLKDYLGTNNFSKTEYENAFTYLNNVQNECKKSGITFAAIIPPNKSQVYFRNMPLNYYHSDISRTDKLIDYLQNKEIRIFNPKNILTNESVNHHIYLRYDTHWNNIGAFIALKYLLENIGYKLPSVDEMEFIPAYTGNHDLSESANISETLVELEKNYSSIRYNEFYKKGLIKNTFAEISNNKSTYNKKILLIGDSYREAMAPALCSFFETTTIFYNGCWDWHSSQELCNLINENKPDIVIFECLERFIYLICEKEDKL